MAGKYKPRVLIVDDDRDTRALISAILESLDCTIVGEGKNGAEAVKLFAETQPDLVLLDIQMPDENGVTALKEILRAAPKAAVVMLTVVDDVNVVDDCILAGAQDYLRKDRGPEALRTRIKRITDTIVNPTGR